MAVLDVGAGAGDAGFAVREAALVLVGGAAMTTPVIDAAPLRTLGLPLTVLVWADALETKVAHVSAAALRLRYDLGVELSAGLTCIADIVDVVIDR